MVAISGEMHEELGLPYRRLAICTGDLSAGKYRQFDAREAWLPGMKRWAETGSASNFLDWQSRRLNVKYTSDGRDGGENWREKIRLHVEQYSTSVAAHLHCNLGKLSDT